VRAAIGLPAIQASDLATSWALYVGAALATGQSDHAEARRMLETCLELRRGLGNDVDIAATLSTLSLARLQAGDVESAAQGEREALQTFERTGDRFGQAICLLHIAQIHVFEGHDSVARDFADRCLALAREIGHKEIEAECELVQGEIAFEAGDLAGAWTRVGRSLQVCKEAGDKRGDARAEWWLGRVALQQGELSAASRHLRAAVRAFSDAEMRDELLGALEDCSRLAHALAQPGDAARLASAAASSRTRMNLVRSRRDDARWSAYLRELEEVPGDDASAPALQEASAMDVRDAIRLAEAIGDGLAVSA
jgi:tetratricopeptide (TPR) repeat protein